MDTTGHRDTDKMGTEPDSDLCVCVCAVLTTPPYNPLQAIFMGLCIGHDVG